MALIADLLLLAAALGAAFYCRVLATRLKRLSDTDNGLGSAISGLSLQVDEMKSALAQVSKAADKRAGDLAHLTSRADHASRRLELLLASLHQSDTHGQSPHLQMVDEPSVLKLSPQDQVRHSAPSTKTNGAVSRRITRKLKPARTEHPV